MNFCWLFAVQKCKSTFMGGNSRIVSAQRKMSVRVSRMSVTKAYLREYPEPEFIAEVKEAFPEKPIANIEEARVRNVVFFLAYCLLIV